MKIFKTVCNSYLVNSYLLIAENGEGILLDPACKDEAEFNRLQKIIKEYNASIVGVIATHTHADHIMGAKFVLDAYPNVIFLMHEEGEPLYKAANDYGLIMGFKKREMPNPTGYVIDNEILRFSNIELQVFYTPGHAPGSICLYSKADDVVFTGDVLFCGDIGRTDLPGGSFEVLRTSIYEKLLTLPPYTIVLPGHGDSTTIEFEKENNRYL